MKTHTACVLSVIAVAGALAVAGCGKKPQAAGVGERTGAALDKAAEKTAEKAKTTAESAKDLTGQALQKSGEVIEKAGASVEKTGADMQK